MLKGVKTNILNYIYFLLEVNFIGGKLTEREGYAQRTKEPYGFPSKIESPRAQINIYKTT